MSHFESIESGALLNECKLAVRHARRANNPLVVRHFVDMASERHAVLEYRSELLATVTAMFAPVVSAPVPVVDVSQAAAILGNAYGTETDGNGNGNDGGAKVRRRPRKPRPSGGNAVSLLTAGRV